MKKALLYLSLTSIAAIASGAGTPTLSGTWRVHNNIAGNESDQTCTFTQKAASLIGSCTSDNGKVNISGKIDGTKITWSYKSEYQGTPLTVNYEGTLKSPAKIAGTVSVPEFDVDGDFTATASK